MLNDATSVDDSPTPGYILADISKQTLSSYPACTSLIEYLVKRLSNPNHNIKYKSLVIIRHVCRTGRLEFKREMARNVEPIKECLQFRGPPDVLRGDEIYKRVRDAAREALDAVFDSQMPVNTSSVAAANRIQGIGGGEDVASSSINRNNGGVFESVSSALSNIRLEAASGYQGHPGSNGDFSYSNSSGSGYSGGSSSGGGGTYRGPQVTHGYTGMGNPNFRDPREELSWSDKAKEASTKAFESAKSLAGAWVSKIGASIEGGGPTAGGLSNSDFSSTYASNRGAHAYNKYGNVYTPNSSASAPQPVIQVPQIVPELPPAAPGYGRAGGAANDGQYEKAMVDGLCSAAGLKAVPPEDKLKEFLSASVTLSSDVVGECLLQLLNSDAWQTRTKALIVIAKLARAPNCDAHVAWWKREAIDDIQALLSDDKAGVRAQAAKTLKVLNVDSSSTPAAPAMLLEGFSDSTDAYDNTQGSAGSSNNAVVDLLGGDSFLAAAPVAHASYSAPLASTTGDEDIFAGMTVAGGALATVENHATSVPIPPVAAPVSAFDFLDSRSSISPTPAPVIAQAPVPVSSTPSASSFDFMQPAPAADLFDGLTTVTYGSVSDLNSSSPHLLETLPLAPRTQNFASDFAGLALEPTAAPVAPMGMAHPMISSGMQPAMHGLHNMPQYGMQPNLNLSRAMPMSTPLQMQVSKCP